ncbi:HNH endonuclease [Streptomyces sp. NPDC052225]|uniref:HNH endonuclease n=1 Tax=Streptomyces sp. NPDC052225 TaxID=3154949 RepID=UPI003428B81C
MARTPWSRDELLLACALVAQNDWRELRQTDERVFELSGLLRALPTNRDAAAKDPRFRSVNSVSRKTTDIATAHPDYPGTRTRGGKPTRDVVGDFLARPGEMADLAEAIRIGMDSGELHSLPTLDENDSGDEDVVGREGELIPRLVRQRERDPRLRRQKIEQARCRGQAIQCEVCGFDFQATYGQLGSGYIEVHHRLPLHISGRTETRLDDLAFLCANCHRMCHKGFAGESWRTPDALRAEIAKSAIG